MTSTRQQGPEQLCPVEIQRKPLELLLHFVQTAFKSKNRGVWWAQSGECVTLDTGVVSSSPKLGGEST